MAKLGPYQVHVRDLPTRRRFEVPAERVGEWLAGHPLREALGPAEDNPDAGHGATELELYADGANTFASGDFDGEVVVACSRCVSEVRIPIREKLLVTFMPQSEVPSDDEAAEGEDGAEVTESDLDVFGYDGEVVDLEPLFREQFVLAVPYAPLCREDCKGLCPQCGIDRNAGACSCEAPIDPRLAGLKGLKLPS
jgi:uncharacterized protein